MKSRGRWDKCKHGFRSFIPRTVYNDPAGEKLNRQPGPLLVFTRSFSRSAPSEWQWWMVCSTAYHATRQILTHHTPSLVINPGSGVRQNKILLPYRKHRDIQPTPCHSDEESRSLRTTRKRHYRHYSSSRNPFVCLPPMTEGLAWTYWRLPRQS